jgi:hypothetical protein
VRFSLQDSGTRPVKSAAGIRCQQREKVYFTDYTLTGQQNESPPRKSVACRQPAGRAVFTGRRSREARKIYFTSRTLSGNKGLLAFDTGRRHLLPMVP